MSAGYSGTPLPRKLGIKPGHRVLVIDAPAAFELSPIDGEITLQTRAGRTAYDVVLVFCPDRATLRKRFATLRERTATAGALWVAWPKKSSGVRTDLDENAIRDVGLEEGLVDVKVCAIDETWSGLKFVRRLVDR